MQEMTCDIIIIMHKSAISVIEVDDYVKNDRLQKSKRKIGSMWMSVYTVVMV